MQENKQEKSPIKQKILLYLEQKGVSAYDFYKKSGVTRGVLGQNNGISEDNLSRFLAYASDINIQWLMTGVGDMLCSPPPHETFSGNKDKQNISIDQEKSEDNKDNGEDLQPSTTVSPSQEKEPRGKVAQDTTDPSVAELARIITEQAKELARQSKEITDQAREIAQRDVEIIQLKEQVRQLTTQKARDAADAPSQDIAHVG